MPTHLTLPQYLYLGALGCYLLFFALFLRLFWWKRYADHHFWHRRPRLQVSELVRQAHAMEHSLPRFSVLVPARNESDVIERTIDHMASLEYPSDRYEIMVITDQKEEIAAAERRTSALAGAIATINGDRRQPPAAPSAEADELVLAFLGRLSLEGFDEVRQRLEQSEGLLLLRQIPEPLLRPLVWESASRLLRRSSKQVTPHLMRQLRLRLTTSAEEELQSACAALLSIAIPTAVAYCRLRGGDGGALSARLAVLAARAHHSLTRELIQAMCGVLAAALIDRMESVKDESTLAQRLEESYREIFPTTQDIVMRKVREFATRPQAPVLKHVAVPPTFDGALYGASLDAEVSSTKGRALNYGLAYIDGRTTWCAFYDAESRPDAKAMLYVAHRVLKARINEEATPRIFQGPVFQVRNWYDMGPFCKIASLYQAIAHDWYLPALFRRLPFVGGTNLFVEARLLREIGGYDATSLTEDLELGTRAFLQVGAWPEYLPYPSSEQTPPTFVGFYRQRLRWATGHLQVMAKVKAGQGYDEAQRRRLLRELWRKGQGEWIFYQSATLVPPLVIALYGLRLIDPNVIGRPWHTAMNLLSTVYIGFTIYAFFRYLRHLDQSGRPRRWMGQVGALAQLLILPLAAFLFPVPYSSALLLSSLGRGPSQWVKTPRTRE